MYKAYVASRSSYNNHLPFSIFILSANTPLPTPADRREFIKISQAVGFGFLIMGAIGYVIKLSESAGNTALVAIVRGLENETLAAFVG